MDDSCAEFVQRYLCGLLVPLTFGIDPKEKVELSHSHATLCFVDSEPSYVTPYYTQGIDYISHLRPVQRQAAEPILS